MLSALQSAGVTVQTAKDIAAGKSIADSLASAVLQADFVCIVVDSSHINANVAFEAGVACGSRRPVVVVSTAPPGTLQGSPFADLATIRYSEDNQGKTVLADAIRAFVENVQPAAVYLAINWDNLALHAGSRRAASLIKTVGLERRVAERLARAGALVNTEVDRRIDLVATFPSLGTSIDQLVVEVKEKFTNHRQNKEKLQRAMRLSGSLLGLLIYGEPVKINIHIEKKLEQTLFDDEASSGIWVMSIDQLDEWSDAELLQKLTQFRNLVIHSIR